MDNLKIGYLGFSSPTASSFMGGLMVVDGRGFPLEFKYSEPIQPTKVQTVLYGKVLERHVKLDVISDSLMKSVSQPFSILMTQDDNVLEHDFKTDIIIGRISTTKSPPLTDTGDFIKIKEREYLIQTSPNSNPLRVQFAKSKKMDEKILTAALQALAKAGQSMDIDEPMTRVYRALDLICQQIQSQQSAKD